MKRYILDWTFRDVFQPSCFSIAYRYRAFGRVWTPICFVERNFHGRLFS